MVTIDKDKLELAAKALWDHYQNETSTRYGFSNQFLFGKQCGEVVTWEEITSPDVIPWFADEYREKARIVIESYFG